MAAIAGAVIWVACLIGWWKLWVLMEHPWPLYFGMVCTLGLGLRGLLQPRSWPSRALGGVVAALSIAFVIGLLLSSHYGSERPRGPAIGDPFPRLTLSDTRDGSKVSTVPPTGSFAFFVFFRGFW